MNSFFKDLLERALKTAAQTAIATIGTTATLGAVDWNLVISTVLMASLLSAFNVDCKQIHYVNQHGKPCKRGNLRRSARRTK